MTAAFTAKKGVFLTAGDVELQTVDGLGFRPLVVVAWWSNQCELGSTEGNRGGVGFWTEHESAAVAWASEDRAPVARTGHRAERSALLGLNKNGSGIVMRADVSSFDPDGLTLRWDARPGEPWLVHFLALGGALHCPRVDWISASSDQRPESLDRGNEQPDLKFVVPAGGSTIGIGAASRREQVAAGYSFPPGSAPGSVVGMQRSDTALLDLDGPDARACYLALEGVRARVGTDTSPTQPGKRRTRVGFRAEALVLFSWGLAASRKPRGIGRLCIGAASGGESGCISWDDRNVGASETSSHAISSSQDVLVVANTRTGGVHAQAELASIDDRGFTLDWSESDGTRREFAWVALAAPDTGTGVLRRVARYVRRR